MTPGWQQGRAEVDDLLSRQHLQRVPANLGLAHAYIEQATSHLASASSVADEDPIGAFQLAYDSARKALASLLAAQGLRPTSARGHIAVQDAVMAQFGGVIGDIIRRFSWMRRVRNSSEYPSLDQPVATIDDARQAQEYAKGMVDAAERLVDQLPVY